MDRVYLHGVGVDAIAADDDLSGNVVWALPDAVGTVRDLLDATGAWVRHRVYDSFGNVVARVDAPGTTADAVSEDDAWLTVYGWTGRPWDAMAGDGGRMWGWMRC